MNIIKRTGSGRPHKTALIFGDQRMIYQEPDEMEARCAIALERTGHLKGRPGWWSTINQTGITRILSW